MKNTAALHSKGWAGLAFVILLVAQAVLDGFNMPLAHSDAGTIAGYIAAHQHAMLIAGWLTLPIVGFFLWFSVGISQYLRAESREDDGLPTFALICGVGVAAVYLLQQTVLTALVFAGSGLAAAGLTFWWSFQALTGNAFLAMPLLFFIFAVAHSMRRQESAPWWLAWLGYLAALSQGILSFGMFSPSSVPGNSALLFILGFILFVLWMICTAGYLVALPGREKATVPV